MRVLSWEDIERMRRLRRELIKRELAKEPRPKRRRPRPKEEILRLASIAARAFNEWFEVVECRERKRVLRMRF